MVHELVRYMKCRISFQNKKKKLEKLVHLFGSIIRNLYDVCFFILICFIFQRRNILNPLTKRQFRQRVFWEVT